MAPLDPATWSLATWLLHGLALYYMVMFFAHWARFRRLEKRAFEGEGDAVERFNGAIQGFPAAGFAKMLGKRPLVAGRDEKRRG